MDTTEGRSRHLVIWSRNHEYNVLLRKNFWSYYQNLGLEIRYALGKVWGTQDRPTLRLASHHYVICLNLIKNHLNTCILDSHTQQHASNKQHGIFHSKKKNIFIHLSKQKRSKYIKENPSIHLRQNPSMHLNKAAAPNMAVNISSYKTYQNKKKH